MSCYNSLNCLVLKQVFDQNENVLIRACWQVKRKSLMS